MSALSLRSTLHGCVPSDHQRCIIPKQKAPPRVGACLTVPDASRLISTQRRGSQHQSSRMACSLNKGLGASVAMHTWVKGPIRQLATAQSLMADQLAPAQIQARENHSTHLGVCCTIHLQQNALRTKPAFTGNVHRKGPNSLGRLHCRTIGLQSVCSAHTLVAPKSHNPPSSEGPS